MTAMNKKNVNRIMDLLVCPATKALGKGEVPLNYGEGELTCGKYSYPITKFGIPNLRLPFDQEEFTSYDDILGDFKADTPNVEVVLEVNGLREQNVRDKIVLLGGTGSGTDIEWILSLSPKILVCLDYSHHIENIAKAYSHQENIAFVVADICDLPFRSNVFDLIVSQGIIQHTRSPELAFSEKVRALSPMGILSVGNLYSKNRHNNYVAMYRHKYLLHEMDRESAKKFIRRNSKFYYWMAKIGMARFHRRFHFPGVLHFASVETRSVVYHYNNATDFYMVKYRHLTSAEEVRFWSARLDVEVFRSSKGFRITKPKDTI
ncbi:MAG: class I SAM-dependent methyltransferase [Rhizobiaceae bacterium]